MTAKEAARQWILHETVNYLRHYVMMLIVEWNALYIWILTSIVLVHSLFSTNCAECTEWLLYLSRDNHMSPQIVGYFSHLKDQTFISVNSVQLLATSLPTKTIKNKPFCLQKLKLLSEWHVNILGVFETVVSSWSVYISAFAIAKSEELSFH